MQRRAITISGIVQGVGFRPFVYSLATQMNLGGFVQNCAGEVLIEVEGTESLLNEFTDLLQSRPPPLSRIEEITWQTIPVADEARFRIAPSGDASDAPVFVSPDLATCPQCRRELFDPADRRFHYPFVNCTQCGPRLTIIDRAPYDRENTTMAPFRMCDRCRAEYEDPSDRRFHAQPVACPDCGPQVRLLDESGRSIESANQLDDFCAAIRDGAIGAIKGVGGYHLVCDATSDAPVQTLRRRKHRYEKPFALMVADADVASKWCEIDAVELELLVSPRRPIVLLPPRDDSIHVSRLVAPGNSRLGIMLPSTPLHELLLDVWGETPLVMTSGNRSDEPTAYRDDDAVAQLAGIADVFLVHNREIRVRCDDSVTRVIGTRESPIRRSRGYAPLPVKLPSPCPLPALAVGGQLKNVFALSSGRHAYLSHHIGDLDHLPALEAFKRDIELYEQLFAIKPCAIIHDLHPDYASTTYAVDRAARGSLQTLGVQHHHAHLASCMAEHGLEGEVIGVLFDGSGYGEDETIWGGEFLVGGYDAFTRAAHLRPVRQPGGDTAARQPWRMALSYLADAECDTDRWIRDMAELEQSMIREQSAVVQQMINRGVNSPWTSSAGRLFDAVAALAGIRHCVSFEGQAAMQLESIALDVDSSDVYPGIENAWKAEQSHQVDTRPLIRAVITDVWAQCDAAIIARRFHNTLSAMIVDTCDHIAATSGLDRVVLSGGVFMNAILSEQVARRLRARGLQVFQHHVVPPGDGGLCLGQLAIAARKLGTQ